MINLGDVKTLIGIITACVLAALYFAPKADVNANREQIAMISAQAQLTIWEDRKGELEDDCLNRVEKAWLCGDDERAKWRRYYREIQLLEKQLGIEPLPEALP